MAETIAKAPLGGSDDTSFFGHPKGLAILFLTEMWERFSYYGMRALLIFYLTQHFLFSDQRSAMIYGAYTALVYVTPVIGGTLADRFLGSRKAVTFGAILLVLGHFGMAFEGKQSQEFVSYEGASYEIVTEGRGDNAKRHLAAGNDKFDISFSELGIEVEGTEGTIIPALLPAGAYEKNVQTNPTFLNIFYLSLALIIAGVGFLKANISTIVGALYDQGDIRRDSGFTIYYMGINLGSFLATLACGYLGQTYGWKYGFGLAGFGMLLGLFVFTRWQSLLGGRAEPPNPAILKEKVFAGLSRELLIYVGGVVMVGVSFVLIKNEGFVGDLLNGFALLVIATILSFSLYTIGKKDGSGDHKLERGVFYLSFVLLFLPVLASFAAKFGIGAFDIFSSAAGKYGMYAGLAMLVVILVANIMTVPSEDRDRMLVASFLILVQLPFWSLFEQAGSSLSLLTDRAVDRNMFGWEIPASMFQSLNAFFIFTIAPLFAAMWIWLAKHKREPSTPVKFSIAVLLVGLGFIVLVQGMKMSGTEGLTPMIWIVLLYLLHTMGELCLSPVGLSAITKLSMPRVVGMMMGAWFLASGFANYVAGIIAASTGAETVGGEIVDLAAAKANYIEVYAKVGMVAIGIAIAIFIVTPILKKGMHGTR